jgi:drug/metabolite transporter (DMT)-like permease
MNRREKIFAYGSWIAVCFFWGTTYLGIRIGLETLPPALLAAMRFFAAGTVLFVVMRASGARLPRGREWVDQAVIGLLLLGVGNGIVVWSEQWLPSGLAALMIATSPFWVTGMERAFKDGAPVTARIVTGLLIGFSGMVILVWPSLFGSQVNIYFVLGIIAIQIGCFAWTGGSIYAKHHPSDLKPMMSAAIQMLIAGVALGLLGTVAGEWPRVHFSARSLGALIYLIVFGSLVAYSAYLYAIQKLPLSLVTMYSYINPVIAVVLGWALLAEPLGWRVALATAIILGGVALVKTPPRKSRKKVAPSADNGFRNSTEEAELPRSQMSATAVAGCSAASTQ